MLLNTLSTLLAETEDDFFALSQTFALPKINYVDIAMREQLPQILSRWALMTELAQHEDPVWSSPPAADGNTAPRG